MIRTVSMLLLLWFTLGHCVGVQAAESVAPTPAPDPLSEDVLPGLTGEPLPKTAAPVQIEGFRSAWFGMTETKVRLAIRKDFGDVADALIRTHDQVEKTITLQVTVPDLLPAVGKAKIWYVLGYKTGKLIKVTIGWGAAAGEEIAADPLIDAANLIRDHLLRKSFDKENVLANWHLADGSTVVFRGRDTKKRTVLLVLEGEKPPPPANPDGKAPPPPPDDGVPPLKITTLTLSYVEDTEHPDIYRLMPQAF